MLEKGCRACTGRDAAVSVGLNAGGARENPGTLIFKNYQMEQLTDAQDAMKKVSRAYKAGEFAERGSPSRSPCLGLDEQLEIRIVLSTRENKYPGIYSYIAIIVVIDDNEIIQKTISKILLRLETSSE